MSIYLKQICSVTSNLSKVDPNLKQPPSAQPQVNINQTQIGQIKIPDVKPKHTIIKILVIGLAVLIGLIIMAIIGFIALGIFSLKPGKTASARIESPGTIYSEDSKLYIADKGKVLDTGIGTVQKTPPVIWIYDLPSGNLLNQAVSGTSEYQEAKKVIDKYYEVNRWKLIPLSNGVANGATSSTTNKTYIGASRIIEGKGAVGYIDVFTVEKKKIKELPYDPELIFNSISGYIYFTENKPSGVFLYKLDSNTDTVVLRKQFPINESSLGIQMDYSPFISDEGIYLLPIVIPTEQGKPKLDILIYDLTKDEFLPKIRLAGQYGSVFARGNDIFLSGRSGVIQVDKNSGKIIKQFSGKY